MLTVTVGTDNAAFHEDDRDDQPGAALGAECARILRHVADEIESGATGGRILDVNGNAVGRWEVTP